MYIPRLVIRTTLAFGLVAAPAAFAAAPSIQSVVNAANFQAGIASATWVAITGANLASGSRTWGTGDFNGGNLPTKLDDVSVTINGIAAFVYFISPSQINVLAPDDPTSGQISVVVTNSQGTSLPARVAKNTASPGLFAYSPLGGRFAIGQVSLPIKAGDSGLIAPPNLLGPTVNLSPASPGETIILYGTGLGPVVSGQPTGQLVAAASPTTNPVTVTVGGQKASVQFAGLIESGLYQLNVVVPVLHDGDAQIVLTVNGIPSAGAVYLPVEAYGDPSGQGAPTIANCISGPVNSVTFSTARLSYGQADSASVGGTQICANCSVKPPLYPEFAARLELALERNKNVSACYDSNGQIYKLELGQL